MFAIKLALLGLAAPSIARAEEESAEPIDSTSFDPNAVRPWMVGLVLERAGQSLAFDRLYEQLVGVDVTYRWRHAGISGRALISPARSYENIRGLVGLGGRAFWELFGVEWTFGVGATAEVRLEDHFGLIHLVPAELGAAVYRNGPFRVDARVGVRWLVAGELIQSFLLDPNGFDNENAQDALDQKKDLAWDVFVTLAFLYELD